jgi:hypothetical protein
MDAPSSCLTAACSGGRDSLWTACGGHGEYGGRGGDVQYIRWGQRRIQRTASAAANTADRVGGVRYGSGDDEYSRRRRWRVQQRQKVWTASQNSRPSAVSLYDNAGSWPVTDLYYTVSDTPVIRLQTHENKQDLTEPINPAFRLPYKTANQTRPNCCVSVRQYIAIDLSWFLFFYMQTQTDIQKLATFHF